MVRVRVGSTGALRARAEPTDPTDDLKAAIIDSAVPATIGADDEQLFQLHLDRVLLATYARRGQRPPVYERWADSGSDV